MKLDLHVLRRLPVLHGLRCALFPVAVYVGLDLLVLHLLPERAWQVRTGGLIAIGMVGLWRYSWLLVHITRSLVYQGWVFPRIRRRADALPEDARYPSRLYFVIATYREKPWVSQKAFHSLLREVAFLPCRTTLLVSTGSDEEDAAILQVVDAHPNRDRVELRLLRQTAGKRFAMGYALRAICRERPEEESLTILMDGDCALGPDVLHKTLPLFRLFPHLGAVTTDEVSLVDGPRWYREWYALRFSIRHRLMKSLSLSRRVLALTGRFSIYRTGLAVDEEFLRLLETDELDHWLHGRFRFLTGDDKSTWFHLLREGWEMLYVPDAVIFSMETAGEWPLRQSIAKMYRWFGNMVRNNGRAVWLGPRRMGLFVWWCLVDQRVSMWTTLVGPTGALLLALLVSPFCLVFYLCGAVLARLFYLALLAAEGHRLSLWHLPQLFYTQWVGALVKIHLLFRLDLQSWGERHSDLQALRASRGFGLLRRWMPRYLTALSGFAFLSAMTVLVDVFRIPRMLRAGVRAAAAAEVDAVPTPRVGAIGVTVDARELGVVPDGDRPAGAALRRALAALPATGPATLLLPAGRIRLDAPLVITRDDTRVLGAGPDRTCLVADFDRTGGTAAVEVRGAGRDTGRRCRLVAAAHRGDRLVRLEPAAAGRLVPGEGVWLGAPNTREFLDELGATAWDREYPWLRQVCTGVAAVSEEYVLLDRPLSLDLPAGASLEPVRFVARVSLSGFSVTQRVAAEARDVAGRYENAFPERAVDGVAFLWARDGRAGDLAVVLAGRHPLNVESSVGVMLADLRIDGAWNKGEGGNGYVRFARCHGCRLEHSEIANLRHLAFQWSAAENLVTGCRIGADVNFHGGYSHDNSVEQCTIVPPAGHPWPPVARTPPDASWAPPDGPNNRVEGK